jgi:hypothetical protein
VFLLDSSDNTLRFVEHFVQLLVNEPGHLSHMGGEPILDFFQAPVEDQELAFNPIAVDTTFTWAHGPDGRYKGRPHPPSDAFDDSASLSSSQVSLLQVRTRAFSLIK